MKERTSSRGLHFGHFRAATEHDDIMDLHYRMAEIPFRTGYVPKRWKKANNVMILKKEGVSDLDRLRTLVLFESDFNHNNKFLGREMMHQMIDREFIANEQYSRPGRKCIDHVVNRKLYFDIVRYQKTSAAMAAVDLKSCYDRVAHAPAYLAMRSYGIPSEPLECMFQAIQDMQYYTVTHHGVSNLSFGGKEKGYTAKPNGLGQGNGGGPSAWSVQSSKMFQVMHKRGSSTQITSPITGTTTDICGFAYVDDTDLIAMLESENDGKQVTERMQKIVDDWEGIAKTTGGALSPQKCWCWIIKFGWKGDTWFYEDTTKSELQMTVKDEKNKPCKLSLLPPNAAREMLGVSLAPDGNNEVQIEIAKNKMKHLAEQIRVGHINKHEAWISLNSITMKTLEYMLPAMTITEDEYRSIMAPVLKQFLPKMGINRNIKRDILYATSQVQGFNLKNPFLVQGIKHVKDICENLWKSTLTGHMLTCNLEQLRIELGENIDILQSNYYQYEPQLLTQSFTRDTWKFMADNNISLDDNTAKIPYSRQGDRDIMECFRLNKNIPTSSLKQLNRCRLYVQAFTLSDIVTSCGAWIRNEAWHGRKCDNGHDRKNWPIWGRPSLKDWTYWRTALRSTFCKEKEKKLDRPLGNWTTIPVRWKFFAVEYKGVFNLLQREGDKWYLHKKMGRSKLVHRYQMKRKKITSPPKHAIFPVTVQRIHKSYIMNEPSSVYLKFQDTNDKAIETWWLNIDKLKQSSEYRLAEAIRNNRAIAVSDGSYSEELGKGTASWMITTNDRINYVTAGAISPGQQQIQSAYRSEILGILGILEEIHSICKKRKILSGGVAIFCDGLSALQVVEKLDREKLNSRYTACDLLSACVALKERIPIELTFIHVHGHQDENEEIHKLSLPSQLNVLMDGLAKDLLKTPVPTTPFNTHQLSLPLPLVEGNTIYEDFKNNLYKHITSVKAHKYWISKQRYKEEDIDCIEWELQEKAFSSEKSTRQRKLSKWISGWLGTGRNMKRWNLRYKGLCPFCKQEDEDTKHVLRCRHNKPTTHWKTLLKEFDGVLIKQKTCYSLRKAIICELRVWRTETTYLNWTSLDKELLQAVMEQRRIGWGTFMEGLISTRIVEYQKQYLAYNYPDRKISSWTKKIIKAGWNLLMKMWQHRNDQLHSPDTLLEMEGKRELNKAILAEWNLGLSDLPAFEFTHFFRLKKDKLMKKSIDGKKDWLANVKMARELYSDRNKIVDEFNTNQALREWIGLPNNDEQLRLLALSFRTIGSNV